MQPGDRCQLIRCYVAILTLLLLPGCKTSVREAGQETPETKPASRAETVKEVDPVVAQDASIEETSTGKSAKKAKPKKGSSGGKAGKKGRDNSPSDMAAILESGGEDIDDIMKKVAAVKPGDCEKQGGCLKGTKSGGQ